MSFLFKRVNASVGIQLKNCEDRPQKKITDKSGQTQHVPIFSGDESVAGEVSISVNPGKKLEHIGVRVELIGQIEIIPNKKQKTVFTQRILELSQPDTLTGKHKWPFEFKKVKKPHESYQGDNANIRYYVMVVVSRNYSSSLVAERAFWVQHTTAKEPELNNTIKLEVGIEDCLHIEFEYNKSKYHLNDIILGKVYFQLIRVNVEHMELGVIRRETAGSGSNVYKESTTLTKFEVMDGSPSKGECIPIRLFLSGMDLSPTIDDAEGKLCVRYFLNLVLVGEDERRYFKQHEIMLYRKENEVVANVNASLTTSTPEPIKPMSEEPVVVEGEEVKEEEVNAEKETVDVAEEKEEETVEDAPEKVEL